MLKNTAKDLATQFNQLSNKEKGWLNIVLILTFVFCLCFSGLVVWLLLFVNATYGFLAATVTHFILNGIFMAIARMKD